MTSEQRPFAQVGGLGAVMQSLPKALNEIGNDARIMMPKYLTIEDPENNIRMHYEGLRVPTDNVDGPNDLICNVKKYEGETEAGKPNTTYFLENMEYYEKRANIYGYADDTVRWALLCRGALEFLCVSDWIPDIIVSTDWTTGYLSNYLKTKYQNYRRLAKIISVFSIHNLHYQGTFKHKFVTETDYDSGQAPMPAFEDPKMKLMNGMRRGIMYADAINTVSPTYAKEILSQELGEDLEEILGDRRGDLYGILNGIDCESWNPATDKSIAFNYSLKDLSLRTKNKTALQAHFRLNTDPRSFLIGIVSRMSEQKGFSLLEETMETLMRELNIQLVIIGEGDSRYMDFFQKLKEEFSDRIGFQFKFDGALPRMAFAGCDAILIPSKFEPSGLTQMEAMRYGAVPIVRKTGGLADTVSDPLLDQKNGTGFVFEKFDSFSLAIAIVRAYENYHNQKVWSEIQKNGMKQDFSWKKSAIKYAELFHKVKPANPSDHQPGVPTGSPDE